MDTVRCSGDKILSLYAHAPRSGYPRPASRGLRHRGFADWISRVTDAVLEEVREWQSWPLDTIHLIVSFDAMRVKTREKGLVKNAVYVALAYNSEKDLLRLWIEQPEGAKFWLWVVNELKTRGVDDMLIPRTEGRPGSITSVFLQTLVQTCIVHLIRNSLACVSWKDRKAILPSIKAIYLSESIEAALLRLSEFEAEWTKRYPAIGQIWRNAREHAVPFFAFGPTSPK
ncbi:transposase [Bradyrhizobium yuanmingense]|uniref:IS256 family transposase n=1 Tax=Bradyrhizobium yuanmingense TaxID=108015 RepID=UPI0021A3C964|nr:transposase [Bradyrhizobium sp. CB1024]UWU88571.1 transposase [Bradyrhizobium sp. CB1024]